MSDHLETYIEPELEARIVAMVVGEASDFETDELQRMISEKPELQLFHDRIQTVHEMLHSVGKDEQIPTEKEWKLSKQRRNAVLQQLGKANTEAELRPKRRARKSVLFAVLSAAAVVVLLGAIMLPGYHSARSSGPFLSYNGTARLAEKIDAAESSPMRFDDERPAIAAPDEGNSNSLFTYTPNGKIESRSATDKYELSDTSTEGKLKQRLTDASEKMEGLNADFGFEEMGQESSTESAGSSRDRSFAMIGHGGMDTEPNGNDSELKITAGDEITFQQMEASQLKRTFGAGGTVGRAAERSLEEGKSTTQNFAFVAPGQSTPTPETSVSSGLRSGSRAIDTDQVDALIAPEASKQPAPAVALGIPELKPQSDSRRIAGVVTQPATEEETDFESRDFREAPNRGNLAANNSKIATRGMTAQPSSGPVPSSKPDDGSEETERVRQQMAQVRSQIEDIEDIREKLHERETNGMVEKLAQDHSGQTKNTPEFPGETTELRKKSKAESQRKAEQSAGNDKANPDPPDPAKQNKEIENLKQKLAELRDRQTDLDSRLQATPEQLASSSDRYSSAARSDPEKIERHRLNYYDVARDQTRSTFLRDIAEQWEMPVPESLTEANTEAGQQLDKIRSQLDLSEADLLAAIVSDNLKRSSQAKPKSTKDGSTAGTQIVPESATPKSKERTTTGLEKEVQAKEQPFSTFSLHVSDVSFKLAQASLQKNQWPDPDRIRIEEFVNAFDYEDPVPTREERVAATIEQAIHPTMQQRNLLRISMRTAESGRSSQTPLKLTFLLDSSGSMERFDRQATLQRAFSLLARQLGPKDSVTLISFARQPRLVAEQVAGNQSDQLIKLVSNLPEEGGTNLESALKLAHAKAREMHHPGAQSRVILLTDGAANLGDANPERLALLIEQMRETDIAFDAAGIGAEGLNDEILEALTRKGDGRYYLLDRPEDADENFARKIAGALRPAARNVKVQVEFNPLRVGKYQLHGFEKHRLKKEDFRNDQVDAAEMSAAEAGVAVYQVEAIPGGEGDIGNVSVRFQDMDTGKMVEKTWPIPYQPSLPVLEEGPKSLRVAAVATIVASKLKNEPLGELSTWQDLGEVLGSLPPKIQNRNRVTQLQEMITKANSLETKQK